jgi:hypothetical protein
MQYVVQRMHFRNETVNQNRGQRTQALRCIREAAKVCRYTLTSLRMSTQDTHLTLDRAVEGIGHVCEDMAIVVGVLGVVRKRAGRGSPLQGDLHLDRTRSSSTAGTSVCRGGRGDDIGGGSVCYVEGDIGRSRRDGGRGGNADDGWR